MYSFHCSFSAGLKIDFQEQTAWVPLLRPGPGQGDIQELCRRDQEAGDPDEKAGGNNRSSNPSSSVFISEPFSGAGLIRLRISFLRFNTFISVSQLYHLPADKIVFS